MGTVKHKHLISGFTLLETLVTMVIVSVGLLAMAQMLLVTMKQNSQSEARMESSALAKNLLTEASLLIAAPGDCVNSMPVQTRSSLNSARGGQTVSVKCTVLGPSRYLLEATVTDNATGKVTKNQKIYSDAINAQGRAVVASVEAVPVLRVSAMDSRLAPLVAGDVQYNGYHFLSVYNMPASNPLVIADMSIFQAQGVDALGLGKLVDKKAKKFKNLAKVVV